MNNAFTQGFDAFVFGRPVSLNPYHEGIERIQWFDGWYEAKEQWLSDDGFIDYTNFTSVKF